LGDDPIVSFPILSRENCLIEPIGRQWAQAKEQIIKSKAKFIFLDNIQLLFPQTAPKEQYEANLNLLKELKRLAIEKQKVIIMASQLSRKLEKRTLKTPKITDFYPDEPLDEVADIILMLYRPVYYGFTEDANENNIRNQAILSLVKSNYSTLFEMEIEFDRRIPCFNGL
jgi:replicative DNA helicase